MKSIILAIILAESGFNPKAYNKTSEATGLGQTTPIAILEANRVCDLPITSNLYNPVVSLDYTICIYEYYRSISKSDVEAVIMYHSGYEGRQRFRKGLNYGKKTTRYVARVLHFKELFETGTLTTEKFCEKYELPEKLCKEERKW